MKPVHVFIDGEELVGWTEMTLQRSKDQLTGQLDISIFMGYMPDAPVAVDACRGREITVYVGGHLAFIGIIDKRKGTGAKHGEPGTTENPKGGGDFSSQMSYSIGPDEYSVKLSCRGKTKYLIDSSHRHPTTNMMQPTTKQVVEKLVEPWNVEIEWLGTDIKLDKVRFRDGCRVVDELHRVCLENCYYMYETRDGKLRVTDDVGPTQGEPIVLGVNILQFSAEQSEDKAKATIKIKGQRTKKEIRGKDAILETIREIEDKWVNAEINVTVQHYGDATSDALERRGRFEANKRSAASKEITLDVFHVQTPSGEPWDIGQLHYVEIPPEGIFEVFECTALTYTVQADQTLKTALTLSPPPTSGASGSGDQMLSGLSNTALQYQNVGNARRISAGVTFAPGRYPSPWSSPLVSVLPFVALSVTTPKRAEKPSEIFSTMNDVKTRPVRLKLPANYETPESKR